MPLKMGVSDETRQENIEREIQAGKPPMQAVAIGYAEQRKAIAEKGGKAKSKSATHHLAERHHKKHGK